MLARLLVPALRALFGLAGDHAAAARKREEALAVDERIELEHYVPIRNQDRWSKLAGTETKSDR